MAATNRDLAARDARRPLPRRPLLPALLGHLLVTPSLGERIADAPQELSDLLLVLAERAVGDELADEVAREVEAWIAGHLGLDYPWPGNVRELAQCVSNVLIRGEYRPAGAGGASGVRERLAEEILSGDAHRGGGPAGATARWSTPRPAATRRPRAAWGSTAARSRAGWTPSCSGASEIMGSYVYPYTRGAYPMFSRGRYIIRRSFICLWSPVI